jgi:hypothetical protein
MSGFYNDYLNTGPFENWTNWSGIRMLFEYLTIRQPDANLAFDYIISRLKTFNKISTILILIKYSNSRAQLQSEIWTIRWTGWFFVSGFQMFSHSKQWPSENQTPLYSQHPNTGLVQFLNGFWMVNFGWSGHLITGPFKNWTNLSSFWKVILA